MYSILTDLDLAYVHDSLNLIIWPNDSLLLHLPYPIGSMGLVYRHLADFYNVGKLYHRRHTCQTTSGMSPPEGRLAVCSVRFFLARGPRQKDPEASQAHRLQLSQASDTALRNYPGSISRHLYTYHTFTIQMIH